MMSTFSAGVLGLALFALTASTSPPKPEAGNEVDGTLLRGEHYSFILKEPSGWVLDSLAGRVDGVDAVICREGTSWTDAVTVMYARVIHKNSRDKSTMEAIIGSDSIDFAKASSLSKISSAPSLMTRDRKQALRKDFYDGENKNHESVAYIDEANVVVIIALSSRDKKEFDRSLTAFNDVVGSYSFVDESGNPDASSPARQPEQ